MDWLHHLLVLSLTFSPLRQRCLITFFAENTTVFFQSDFCMHAPNHGPFSESKNSTFQGIFTPIHTPHTSFAKQTTSRLLQSIRVAIQGCNIYSSQLFLFPLIPSLRVFKSSSNFRISFFAASNLSSNSINCSAKAAGSDLA